MSKRALAVDANGESGLSFLVKKHSGSNLYKFQSYHDINHTRKTGRLVKKLLEMEIKA